ncbi:hypothetical protein A3A84_02910 [Candidatus Collierbacteria bacterium RIFCSPLOWO2_01_FULL_50_23]|uniref:DDH domain-containing protein n=1 Tax=Candidatus Collierbacteria bacterium RIFCSPHIGHO2_01_FULL_50_25 TaxID=1817722 RepID=A0A1F5EUS4_9BACT|nr:MAG: hypothetical protein A2703_01095 [Candidatus Collierbacteria bacterium RIFCSPHIGHO2_01_FULL_50_25]OGD75017.1 MAG: hypothetical protein A3A84_02910 [Candidatus Collierbacteria bacterium RIFCSPLOWO2_01_FULL_50_23]
MFDQNLVSKTKEELTAAKSVAILLPPDPSTDLVAAGLGLYLSLSDAGKQVQIGSGSQIRVENADLFGVDKIKNSIGNQNLVISFDFKEENLKKVDYDVDENGKFMLLIQPQPGCSAPDTSTINYSYSGASADLVFILGVNSLEELGKIYADEKSFLDGAKIVSLNLTAKGSNMTTMAFHNNAASSNAEMVGYLLKAWDINPTADAASNLLTTISTSTNQFNSPKVTADTFEVIAFLMRHGGNLGRSPFAGSSRFGAFPPSGLRPFMGPDMTPPTFDDDELPPPTPFPGGPGRVNRVPADWNKRPKVMRSGQSNFQS